MRLRVRSWMLDLQRVRIPDVRTLGVTNELEDGTFVLFNDYDDVDYDVVLKDINHVRKVFGLKNFIVLVNDEDIETDFAGNEDLIGSYLLFGLDKLTYWQCVTVQSHMRGDYMHKKIGQVWSKRCWVNRIASKYRIEHGELVELRPEPEVKDAFFFKGPCRFGQSRAFILFFREWFKLDIPLKGTPDGDVELIEYSTMKKRRRKHG